MNVTLTTNITLKLHKRPHLLCYSAHHIWICTVLSSLLSFSPFLAAWKLQHVPNLLYEMPMFCEGNGKTDVHEVLTARDTTHTDAHRQNYKLCLFGLILSLRYINLFPGNKLPNASSVVLVSQSIQEGIEGGRRLSQDGSDLYKQAQKKKISGLKNNKWRVTLCICGKMTVNLTRYFLFLQKIRNLMERKIVY